MDTGKCTYQFQPKSNNRTKRILHVIFIVAFLIVFAFWMNHWLRGELGIAKKIAEHIGDHWSIGVLIGCGVIYILLLSLPLVPGVELGLLLMCVFGKPGIVIVYFSTVAGLSLAFLMGRRLPVKWVMLIMTKIGFTPSIGCHHTRADEMMENISLNQKFQHKRFLSFFAKYRYPAIGLLFNMPGNYLIGGGGGISLACGISRNISWKWFLLTVFVSVSPVPLLVWIGIIRLEAFLKIM